MKLYYFTPPEFNRAGNNWFPLMDGRLLVLLDVLRFRLGVPINLSGHRDAIGRRLGQESRTQHNIDRHGAVHAVDFFVDGVHSGEQAKRVVDEMRGLGFTGIGVYPLWTNNQGRLQVGFHGDTRINNRPGRAAEWGYIGAKAVSIDAAIAAVKS